MTNKRQLPLFPNQVTSVDDLNRRTELRYTINLFQAYLQAEGKSEHTIKAFTSDLQLLADQSGEDTPIGTYTTEDLNAFLDWLEHGRGVPCSRKSYARRVTTLKVYFKWLRTVGAIAQDPALAILQRSGPAPLAAILSPDEVQAAMLYAHSLNQGEKPDPRPEMLFRLLLATGIKKSEMMRLTTEHINRTNPQEPVLTVRHKVRNVYKERHIPLDPAWLPVLDAYLAHYKPRDTIITCTARNLEYILQDIGDGADIPMRISFEMMRWTCAVRDYRAGMEPDEIRDKLGLSDASWQETHSKIKRLVTQQIAEESL